MGDAILTAFPVWEFLFFCKVTCFNACSNFLANRERHATLAALVFLPLILPFDSKKNMSILNETNVFKVCKTPVDIRLGLIRICQLALSNKFNLSYNAAHVVYDYCRDQPPPHTHWERHGFVALPIKRWRKGVWGIRKRQDVSSYELRWDEMAVYIEGIIPNCQWKKSQE